MRWSLLVLLAMAPLALAPATLALPSGTDARIALVGAAEPTVEDPTGAIALLDASPGELYRFTVNATEPYTTVEVAVEGAVDVERPRQLVPHLRLDPREARCGASPGACDYTLFEPFPHERVWEVDGPARVFHATGAGGSFVLRLGIPGPVNATLTLARDVRAPGFTLQPVQSIAHGSFYQETTTDELALADLQVRKVGSAEWVRNPTAIYHVLQRFPVQGLDADSSYEARVLFTDWAGNVNTSPSYSVRTAREPERPLPVVRIVDPAENATLPPGSVVTVRARFESPGSPVPRDGVRVFFDKREVSDRALVQAGEVTFAAGALDAGLHSASVEVANEAGGKAVASWTFHVEGASRAPLPWPLVLLAGALALLARRRR